MTFGMVKRVITVRLFQSLAAIKSVHLFTKNKLSWQELRDRGVEFLVAPYEADARLAYSSRNGSVQAVLSEDSDMLVVYRCGLVLSKLDGGTVLALGWGDIRNRMEGNYVPWVARDGVAPGYGGLVHTGWR